MPYTYSANGDYAPTPINNYIIEDFSVPCCTDMDCQKTPRRKPYLSVCNGNEYKRVGCVCNSKDRGCTKGVTNGKFPATPLKQGYCNKGEDLID